MIQRIICHAHAKSSVSAFDDVGDDHGKEEFEVTVGYLSGECRRGSVHQFAEREGGVQLSPR